MKQFLVLIAAGVAAQIFGPLGGQAMGAPGAFLFGGGAALIVAVVGLKLVATKA